jgi:DNA-binding transcriptional MerR regulator
MTAPESSAATAARAQSLMSIGEVLAHLRTDFPDVTISKLRFLESEGLVEPRRTPSGYRKYRTQDVARLRFVLAAQRDHYLPLKVIREQLAALDRGEPAAAAVREALEPGVTTLPGRPRVPLREVSDRAERADADRDPGAMPVSARLSRADLLARSGLAEDTLDSLEEYGLIGARNGGGYDVDALTVAHTVAQLGEYGLEPRHLRQYRAAADREVGLFTALVAPLARQSNPASRARAAETVRELAALSQQLHAALVRVGLRDTLSS